MALTLLDIFLQSSSRSDFITKTGNDPNAGKMYDQFKKMEGKVGNSSTSFTGGSSIGTTPTEPPSGDKGFVGKAIDGLTNGVKMVAGVIDGAVKIAGKGTALALNTQMGKGEADDTLMGIAGTLGTQGMKGLYDIAVKGGEAILNQLKEESILKSEINTKTGISGNLSDGLRKSMVMAQAEARRYGFELSNIGEFYTQLSDQSGKFSLINSKTIEKAAPVAAALDMSMQQLASTIGEYEKVGIGAKEAMEAIGGAATKSVSLGLNAKKVSDGITASMGMLNQYGFKNGIQGLERMVQKSIEFRVSMESVASIAEKVLSPEGAIDLAANLQVLGGAIGDFGDPLKMMYDATNNVEGLQDSIIGAAKGLATYNQEQGKFEITGINLRRAKAMAKELDIDYKQFASTAIAAQERMAATTALASRGLQIDDKQKEFLTNLSRMEGGEMKIVVPESIAEKLGVPTELALDKLDQKTANALIQNQKDFERNSPADMARAQLTETQAMARDIEVIASWAKIEAASFAKGMGKALLDEQTKKLFDTIKGVVVKPNPEKAETAGKNVVNAVKGLELTSYDSWMEKAKIIKDNLKTMAPNQIASVQQQSPQKVEYTHNIISNPGGDIFAEAARKNAAVGFAARNVNPREYA